MISKLTLLFLVAFSCYAQRVVGGGQITSVSGDGHTVVTTTGTQTAGNCVQIDANGNHVAAGSACSSGGGTLPSDASPSSFATAGGLYANGSQVRMGSPTESCSFGASAYQIDTAHWWTCNGYYWIDNTSGTISYIDNTIDWYVDSVNGSDSNTGKSAAQAYKTLGKLTTPIATNNQLTLTETLTNSGVYIPQRSTAAGSATGIDGSTTGITLTQDSTASNTHYLLLNNAIPAAGTYTLSVYVKAGTVTSFGIQSFGDSVGEGFTLTGSGAKFNVTGWVSPSANNAGIVSLGNGWYRCWIVTTTAGTTGGGFFMLSGTAKSFSGDGTSSLTLWHPMLGTGGTLTAYSPNNTASLTTYRIASGQKVVLATGSTFREQLTVPVSNLRITSYGSGAKPIITASDVVSANSWTLASGQTNAYQATVAIAANALNRVSVWENGTRLRWAASIAACNSTAGTYFSTTESATPITLYVHASDNSNPASNGKSYETATRQNAIEAGSVTGTKISNLDLRRNLHDNGPLNIGRNSLVKDSILRDGTKHLTVLQGGDVLLNVELADLYDHLENTSLLSFFESSGNTGGLTVMNTYGHADTAPDAGIFNDGYLSHTSSGTLGAVVAVGNRVTGVGTAFGFAQTSAVTLIGNTGTSAIAGNLVILNSGTTYSIYNNTFTTISGGYYFLSTSDLSVGQLASDRNSFSGGGTTPFYFNGQTYSFSDYQSYSQSDVRSTVQ